jgi:hypothetical protein
VEEMSQDSRIIAGCIGDRTLAKASNCGDITGVAA